MYANGVAITLDPQGASCFAAKLPVKVDWSTFSPWTRKNRGPSTPDARPQRAMVIVPLLSDLLMTICDAERQIL